MRGGIYRLKEHLAHVGKNVKKCTSATPQALEAKEKCKKAIEAAKKEEGGEDCSVGEELEEVTCVGSSQPHKLGPIDKWTRAIDPTKADSFKQQQLNKELWKEREHEVYKFIARWAYNRGIPFNACDNDEFKQMCEAIGQFGPGLTPPTQDAFRGSLLEEEYERTKCLLQEREAEKMKNGCSIMTDACYANPSIFDEPKMNEAFISCVEQFYYHDEDQQEQAANFELKKIQNREGPFSKKLARTFQNYDYNPASWWRLYGTETPALQKMATRILSLTSSSSGCERNWSGFEGIHTKKRNRLTTTRLNKLVYIQFNNRLMNKREKIKSKKITDVLLSSDTTEAQGFLQEGGDDCAQVVFRDGEEDEMEGTGIPWSVIGETVGAEEQLEPRRSARVRELYEGEEFESEEEEYEDEDLCYSEDEI
ncbi:hAT transposon superfamily protein [Zea mays]|uniref:HAT transposon superfamily protein n=2 Tax=Zea mays TaxID=4577 RepID=A0A1D6MSU4_MAIZE|nr:hAT transposon superfamily protein [Zea mays]